MVEDVFWVFYNTVAKIQSNHFSTVEAQNSILKMHPREIKKYLIWSTGWENWQRLETYLKSDQKFFISTLTASILKSDQDTVKVASKEATKSFSNIQLREETISRLVKEEQTKEENFDGDEITWSNIQKPEVDFSKVKNKVMGKRAIRHKFKIEVLLISAQDKTFRSRSINMSLSGALLEDTIPFDYYGRVFDVVVINHQTADPQKARVKLSAATVGDTGLTQRIQYKNITDLQKRSLWLLLEDYIGMQKKTKAS